MLQDCGVSGCGQILLGTVINIAWSRTLCQTQHREPKQSTMADDEGVSGLDYLPRFSGCQYPMMGTRLHWQQLIEGPAACVLTSSDNRPCHDGRGCNGASAQ